MKEETMSKLHETVGRVNAAMDTVEKYDPATIGDKVKAAIYLGLTVLTLMFLVAIAAHLAIHWLMG